MQRTVAYFTFTWRNRLSSVLSWSEDQITMTNVRTRLVSYDTPILLTVYNDICKHFKHSNKFHLEGAPFKRQTLWVWGRYDWCDILGILSDYLWYWTESVFTLQANCHLSLKKKLGNRRGWLQSELGGFARYIRGTFRQCKGGTGAYIRRFTPQWSFIIFLKLKIPLPR